MDSIIFDVDGTLWDSTTAVADIWMDAMREKAGYTLKVTPAEVQGLCGRLLEDIAAALFPEQPLEKQLQYMKICSLAENECLIKQRIDPYPGVGRTLAELGKNYDLYIVSNCESGYVETFMQVTGLTAFFKGHLCPGDTGMPKAENIVKIMKDYGIQETVYVGDTRGDFESSRKAGVPFVYASYGYGQVDGADYTIDCFEDLLKLF